MTNAHQSDMLLRRDTAARLASHAASLSSRAIAVTVPVYRLNGTRRPEFVASGVLLAIDETRFFITAGHVLDETSEPNCAVGFCSRLIHVNGIRTRLRTPGSKSPNEDHFDIGFVRLSGSSWDSTPLPEFLSLNEIAPRLPMAVRDSFAFIGFPATKQPRPAAEWSLESRALPIAAKGRLPATYGTLGYEPHVNLLLGFDKRQVWGAAGRHIAPDPFGMSGGGVWHFGKRLAESTDPPRLAAIGIEWSRKTHDKVLVATRIDQVLRAIVRKYPTLRPR